MRTQSRQRVYDWRHALGKTAFKAVSEHLNDLSASEKIEHSKAMLKGNRFIYCDPDAPVVRNLLSRTPVLIRFAGKGSISKQACIESPGSSLCRD